MPLVAIGLIRDKALLQLEQARNDLLRDLEKFTGRQVLRNLDGGRARARARVRVRVRVLVVARVAGGRGRVSGLRRLRWRWSGLGGTSLVQGGTRDRVAVERGVDVEQDALVVGLVELRARDALRLVGAAACDLEVHALRVVLRAVGLVAAVQRDDLVAQDVLSWRDGFGDGKRPAVVVGDQVVRGPVARGAGAVDQPGLADLEEVERRLVDGRAVAVAVGQVVDHGPVVALGPGVPLQLDGAARGDFGVDGAVVAVAVADDVGRAEGVGGHEAEVSGGRGPADGVGSVVHVRVLVHKVATVTELLAGGTL